MPNELGIIRYRRYAGRDTWHWMAGCQHFPVIRAGLTDDDITTFMGSTSMRPPSGELCNECLAKEKRVRDAL